MDSKLKLVWGCLGKHAVCSQSPHEDGRHKPINLRELGWPTEYFIDATNKPGNLKRVGIFICDFCGCLYAAAPMAEPINIDE